MLLAATLKQGAPGGKVFPLSGATLLVLALTLPVSWLGLNLGLQPVRLASLQQALWMLVCAPVIEEFVFRRILQRNLADFLSQRVGDAAAPILAVLVSAVIFAICHGYRVGPLWGLLWIVPGLALAEVWRQDRSVWVCVSVHAYFNAAIWMAGRL